jgi:ribulose-phosphate 3-epimerase
MSLSSRCIIAPSILAADFGNLRGELQSIESAGGKIVHIDIMDGNFVPPISFGMAMVSLAKECSSLFLETHLMVRDVERHACEAIDKGSDRVIIHCEEQPHLHRTLSFIKSKGVQCGVAVNPGSHLECVYEVLPLCDVVTLMSVNPGWGGQPFITSTLDKIRRLREKIDSHNLTTDIEIDGGIYLETGRSCAEAGATVLVAGTYFFSHPRRSESLAL